jgi:taurine--2-oxoglutarate transaminase
MTPTDSLETTSSPLTSEEVVQITRDTNYGTWRFQKGWNPLHIVDAEGCTITDASGKQYLDLSAQLMCMNLGHKNQAVIDAIAQQAQALAYAMPGYATNARAELSKLLLEVLPPGLNKFFFTTSGTDANEAAFKIARMYTGKTKVIARYRSYHGSTSASIAATGDPRRWAMEPLRPGSPLLQVPHQTHLPPVRHRLRRLPRAHDPQRVRRRRRSRRTHRRHQRRHRPARRIHAQTPPSLRPHRRPPHRR